MPGADTSPTQWALGDTLFGWPARRWSVKVTCVTCSRGITRGATHPKDKGDPPVRAMCHRCLWALMSDPEHFEDTPHDDPPEAA